MIKKLFGGVLFILALSVLFACKADALIKPNVSAGHPFVYLSDEFVSNLKDENGNVKPEYKASYSNLLISANQNLNGQPEGGYLSKNISLKIMARALMYALGEVDESHARATIEYTLEYLKKPLSAKTTSIEMYKDIGENAIQTGALVYDWCYDALKEDEKLLLYQYVMEQYKDTNGDGSPNYNQPCRADNVNTTAWTDIAGKAVGQPIVYNAIAATAFCDIDMNFYNTMMGKIQGSMADAVKAYGTVGALSDGSIQYGRFAYTYYVYILLQRMGATEAELFELFGDQSAFGYKMMYSRMPWGATMRQGDGYTVANYSINHFTAGTEVTSVGILANAYGNEYFRHHYIKETYNAAGFLKFLTLDCDVKAKLPDDLPLAFKTSSPRTEIMAKTSWKDGINSPAVFAYMNMNERRSGDHDHAHIGSFQLHYKGPLTMPNGVYAGVDWGGSHWRNYYTRSISANCVTVYMPGEVFKFGSKLAESNDGGQRMAGNKAGTYVIGQYDEHFSDYNLWAVTEGKYTGPNEKTPAFSYLKGDITRAYNENKMEGYKRSMVFMDTFNETYPGVMIVFDRVISKKAEYQKKWLLQAVAEPKINGNKITITNTKDGANGKLVNTVLLPENAKISAVGGISKYVVDGVEYPADWEFEAAEAYKSGYRAEVEPGGANTEDTFLNAMFVTDADGNAPDLEMIKEESELFLGVTTLDRTVLFSKNGNEIENEFKINIRNNNQGGKMLCFVGDLKSGKWKVSGENTNIVLKTNDEENCLIFEVTPGAYTVVPVGEGENITNILWEEAPKAKQGEFVIKKENGYINIVDENILIDGVPYISAKTAENLGVKITESENKLTISNGLRNAEIAVGEYKYTLNGNEFDLPYPAIERNETIYIPILQMKSAFGIVGEYVPEALLLDIDSSVDVFAEDLIVPRKVEGVKNAGILADFIVGEQLSLSKGKCLPVIYTFDNVKNITKISVAGGESLSFYSSVDGKNYYLVTPYESSKTGGITTFKVNTVAKYLKFEAAATAKVSEVSVYGENFDKKCAFASGNIKSITKKEPLKFQAYIEKGFENASVYMGETLIYNITEEIDEVYDITIPESALNNGNIKIVATYSGEEYTVEQGINIVDLGDKTTIINESFDGGSHAKVFGQRAGYKFSRNVFDIIPESYKNGKFTVGPVDVHTPYVAAAGFKYGGGFYDICFDAEFSSAEADITFEIRNSDNKNINNRTYSLIFGFEGSYEFIIRADTLNHILRVFAKEKDSTDDYVIIKEVDFPNDSLGQIRFNISSNDKEAIVSLDNFLVDYFPVDISIFSPKQDVSSGNVLFSVNTMDADEVHFYVNGRNVYSQSGPLATGLYEKEISFANTGEKIVDIYVKKGNKVYFANTKFIYGSTSVTDISYDGISASSDFGYIVPDTAKTIKITFNKAVENITKVSFNGEEINLSAECDPVTNSAKLSNFNFTSSGLLEVETEEFESILIYVGNRERLCVLTPEVIENENGEVLAFVKYINGGDFEQKRALILSEYAENKKLSQIKYAYSLLKPGHGILSESISSVDGTYKIMVWNESLENQVR